mmetsp:Transcript_22700/g.52339  ORF Transcript_22700/g.52339 Transcript_22700/m.52339 type:complete len:242 (+) Transcript_22700:443-1168(+)
MASSNSHGKLVAARTITMRDAAPPSSGPVTEFIPSIWTRNSDLMRREASCSLAPPRAEHNESTSSTKMVEGAKWRAMSNSSRTRRSDSPLYLDARVEDDTLKNVVSHSVATDLARRVFPVPGGPNMSTPFHGRRIPWKYSGMYSGSTTASFRRRFASPRPAIASKLIPGFTIMISRSRNSQRALSSGPAWNGPRSPLSPPIPPPPPGSSSFFIPERQGLLRSSSPPFLLPALLHFSDSQPS